MRWIPDWRVICLWCCLHCWAGLSLAAGPHASLLWITGEITPMARTALIERTAQSQGLALVHLDYPIRGGAALSAAEAARLDQALMQSSAVWIDAPHVSVQTRLSKLVSDALARKQAQSPQTPVAWILPEGAGGGSQDVFVRAMSAYLQAGGVRNVRYAVTTLNARLKGEALPSLPAPEPWPVKGLYHPDAPQVMPDARQWQAWQDGQPTMRGRPSVAVLVHRYHLVNGNTDWLDRWLRLFAKHGLVAYAVFGQQVDAPGLQAMLGLPDGSTQGRAQPSVLVSHQLLSQGLALQGLLSAWNRPLLLTKPYRSGDTAAWEVDGQGLSSSDVPFYLAQPEGAGGIDPIMVTAHADQGRRTELIERQAMAVVAKAARLIQLQRKPLPEKRLVAMVYNYPPGGSHFGASFLNVPRSLAHVSAQLHQAGYDTQGVSESNWIEGLKPLLAAYYPQADLLALLDQGQAAALPLSDYLDWWNTLPRPVRQRIDAQWGKPEQSRYVVSWHGQRVFVIPRMQVGKLAVLPQPPREETLRQGQDPFMHRSKTPLSHHYLAVYLWARQADALIHFGTHGTQEWAPGKARGLDIHDDALLPLGDVPVVYPYIVDNLGEALTAKRRGRAVMVSHRTPLFAPAGFEAHMAHMHELMHEWETADAGPTKVALEKQLLSNFVEHNLHRDLGWSSEAIQANFEGYLEKLHPYLDALAQSSQPKGLAVFGVVPLAEHRLQSILQTLRKPLIEALGEDIDEAFLINHDAVATSRPARWLQVALQDAQAASQLDLRPPLPGGPVPNRAARKPIDQTALLQLAQRAQALDRLLSIEGEMPGLHKALAGGFIEAAYGGDPIRNPESMPTGRNLTGLDPSRLPTRQAYDVAQGLFSDWLAQYQSEHAGRYPTRLALSLWAGETLRHQGIMEAQALVALGIKPVWDEAGRPHKLTVIPATELGRPRVDVLLSITGSYRDQFPALMALVDQGVELVSQAEPDNVVVRNTASVTADLTSVGVGSVHARTLARARVFGNVVGDYGTGLADAVQSDGVQRDDVRLGELFLQRMSQPYVDGVPVDGLPAGAAAKALGAHLRQTQAALLSRTSHLYAMVTSDDPFQYLGGLAAAARSAGKEDGMGLYVSQLQDSSEVSTESAQKVIALEMQSRYLHPGWIKAQQQEGYAGTLQVLKAMQFAWGWQVTAPQTIRADHWQSFYQVFVKDKLALGVPQWLRSHPHAYAQSLERLVQAQRMGYWQPDAQTKRELAQLYSELTQQAPLHRELASVRQWVRTESNERESRSVEAGMVASVRSSTPVSQYATASPNAAVPAPLGLVLERQRSQEPVPPDADAGHTLSTLLVWVLLALWAAAGAVWQSRQASVRRVALPASAIPFPIQ